MVRFDFTRPLKRAALDHLRLTPHSMRHSFATWHIAAGRNPKWVQQQLGHRSIAITMDVYADHFALVDADAAHTLGTALVGNRAGNAGGS